VLDGFRQGDVIFDIGANAGDKTDVFLRLGARVVAVEPDEANQKILRERFVRYRLTQKRVTIVGKAVSDADAIETMWIDGPGSAVNTLNHKWVEILKNDKNRIEYPLDSLDFARKKEVETTTLDRLIITYGLPFFVKIDVEGYELKVLRGLQQALPYLSFEVNLPEFKREGLECIELLRSLAPDGTFNYAADCKYGLALDRWVDSGQISRTVKQCSDKSIEVFWKGTVARR
jgi:FkbM family methyltransferase